MGSATLKTNKNDRGEMAPLDSKGIRGDGHTVMIEKNNLEIAKVTDDWAKKNVK